MNLGIDLDGVVVDSIGHWRRVMRRGGFGCGPCDLPDTHGTPERAAYSDANEIEMHFLARPVRGAPEALALLRRRGHRLIVVTARTPRLRRFTEAWLEYHGMVVDEIYMTEGGVKVGVALGRGVELIVEDSPTVATTLARAGLPVMLLAAPYNRGAGHPLVTPCRDWDQVVAEIERRAGSRGLRAGG